MPCPLYEGQWPPASFGRGGALYPFWVSLLKLEESRCDFLRQSLKEGKQGLYLSG